MVGLPPTSQELRILRKRAGLTQKELAKRAGISQSLVARIESGSVDPRVSTLRKILNVLSEASTDVKLSARSVMHQPVIFVDLEETIGKAVELMWKHGISQLPVLQDEKVVGSIKEDTILKKIKDENIKELLNRKVSYLKEDPFPVVNVDTNIENVTKLLLSGSPAVLVNDHGRMIGIITKIDLIAKHLM